MNLAEKRQIVQSISFGGRTAEDEAEKLSRYFVETEAWRTVWEDEVDIVFAPKGGGKSAIYSMLVSRDGDLFDRGIVLVPGENPRGATAFGSLDDDPPENEDEFVKIWRLYFLVLLVEELESYDVRSPKLIEVREVLASIGLTDRGKPRRTIVTRITSAVKKLFSVKSLEGSLGFDASTQVINGVNAKIVFGEPSSEQEAAGIMSIDRLYEDIDEVLAKENLRAWLVLDRLDVAFTSSPELEAKALRGLFRAYALTGSLKQIRLKIFLRSDIWKDITRGGFRETSHLVRELSLEWDKASLLKLIVQRTLQSQELLRTLQTDSKTALSSGEAQSKFFEQVFPAQVDPGSRKPTTFDWAISRCSDGNGITAPRELIHLFSAVKTRQLARIESGHADLADEEFFESQSFREAHPVVSKARLEKTLYAEYPWLTDWLEGLRGERTQQNINSLSLIWEVDAEIAVERVKRLVEVGVFEERGNSDSRQYWVPFLYRPALELVQGSAES